MRRIYIIVICLLIFLPTVYSFQKTEYLEIDVPMIGLLEGINDSILILIEGYGVTAEIGMPALPEKTILHRIPETAYNISIIPIEINTKIRKLKKAPMLQQAPMPRNNDPSYIPPILNQKDYLKFPENYYEQMNLKRFNGRTIIPIAINPVHYYPEENKIEYVEKYIFKISYSIDYAFQEINNNDATDEMAKKIIGNYEEKNTLNINQEEIISISDIDFENLGDEPKNIIITSQSYYDALKPLETWKTEKGIPSKIYTTESIYSNYSGRDNPEKIRNFLIAMEDLYDIDYVTLAGDIDTVPHRNAHIEDPYIGDGTLTPTDWYYADLKSSYSDYDWDRNGNGLFGEPGDDIDYYVEAYVGRISAASPAQMETIISKIIEYEKNPEAGDWSNKMILAGGQSDSSTDEAKLMNYIRTDFLEGKMNYERVYYRNDNYARDYFLSFANFQSRVSQGASIIGWAGHGSYYSAVNTDVGTGKESFVSTSTNPSNGNKQPFVYADSCSTGGFDQSTCLGEDILRDWGIGFIGASRISWYIIGWTGPTQPLNHMHEYLFFEHLLKYKKPVGKAFYDSKIDHIVRFPSYAPSVNSYGRKNLLTYNLLGDPTMEIWTSRPVEINLEYISDVTVINQGDIEITITYPNNLSAVEGATVCITNNEDVYITGTTNSQGKIIFRDVSTSNSADIKATATKQNHIPMQTNITVNSFLMIESYVTDEDFYLNPSSITFQFQVNSSQAINYCRLMIGEQEIKRKYSVSLNTLQEIRWDNDIFGGNLDWRIQCINTNEVSINSEPKNIQIVYSSGFDGSTTDLSTVDIENITNFKVEKEKYGAIDFTQDINLSSGVNLQDVIKIEQNKIEVKSEIVSQLNKSAILTIRNLTIQNPVILRDGMECDDCIVLETGADFIRFQVEHFTTYEVSENSRLMINDSHEESYAEINETIVFSAEYTNKTSNQPISGAICEIHFDIEGSSYEMTYSSGFYLYERNFSQSSVYYYNITCTDLGGDYTALKARDYVKVGSSVEIAQGGDITYLNINRNSTTNRWQGFTGHINTTVKLGIGSDVIINFGETLSGTVFATTSSSFMWSSLNPSSGENVDNIWGFNNGLDNASSTYKETKTIGGISVPSVDLNGEFSCGLFQDRVSASSKDHFAFGATIYTEKEGFDGNNYEYGLIVPTDSTEQYYFYVRI